MKQDVVGKNIPNIVSGAAPSGHLFVRVISVGDENLFPEVEREVGRDVSDLSGDN